MAKSYYILKSGKPVQVQSKKLYDQWVKSAGRKYQLDDWTSKNGNIGVSTAFNGVNPPMDQKKKSKSKTPLLFMTFIDCFGATSLISTSNFREAKSFHSYQKRYYSKLDK